ncbi:ABC transporter substrate-binding protein [Xylophilus sp.]|uniref:ABC transporter substrate-binding protein n=1 Tax=Xylophilus sp. TaxID=2653893 RepID=UPI002D805EFA|nr:ABC transporter substrate-binding protein [Xylophilus sp.]
MAAAGAPVRGGTLVIGPGPELTTPLTSAITTAGLAQTVSGKIFDGLLTFDAQLRPQPQLATGWSEAADGRSITFRLRPGVKWHDGAPFTSADVAFSALEAWKKYHSRGRSTFAPVEAVDTPDALTAVFRLSQPAPYLIAALMSGVEAQVIPRHVFGRGDILANPALNAPIGTGPFRFVRWERGSHIVLERNAGYWDAPRPYLDRVILRFTADPAANAAALEAGEVHIGLLVPFADYARLGRLPGLQVIRQPLNYAASVNVLGFNLDRPVLRDVRVRQAFAHAVDREAIVRSIWHGLATPAESPIAPSLDGFAARDIPRYPLDLARAEALLEQAGLPRKGRGPRLVVTCDAAPTGPLPAVGQLLRSNLAKIGVDLRVRSSDFAEFVNRVYTRRDFDTALYGGSTGPDPTIGIQRYYWSKNFQPGVAFSNGEHYASAEADRLLEAAQTERDAARRRDLFAQLQRRVLADLPRIPLLQQDSVLVQSRRVQGVANVDDVRGNLASAWLAA